MQTRDSPHGLKPNGFSSLQVNIRLSWEGIQEYQHFQDLYREDAGYRPIGYLFLVPPERKEVCYSLEF